MAAICFSLHPASAKRRQAALRRPWAEQCAKPASSHLSLNQFPKPAWLNGAPRSVTRKVRRSLAAAASMTCSSGCIGSTSLVPVFCWVTWIQLLRTCWRPIRVTSLRRCPVKSISEKARRAWLSAGWNALNVSISPSVQVWMPLDLSGGSFMDCVGSSSRMNTEDRKLPAFVLTTGRVFDGATTPGEHGGINWITTLLLWGRETPLYVRRLLPMKLEQRFLCWSVRRKRNTAATAGSVPVRCALPITAARISGPSSRT